MSVSQNYHTKEKSPNDTSTEICQVYYKSLDFFIKSFIRRLDQPGYMTQLFNKLLVKAANGIDFTDYLALSQFNGLIAHLCMRTTAEFLT